MLKYVINMIKVPADTYKISLVVSFLAFTTSIVAICISVKINNQVVEPSRYNNFKSSRSYNDNDTIIINDIPDTTVVRKDGSIVEVKSHKTQDRLNEIVVKNKEIDNDIRNNERKTVNQTEVISKKNTANDTRITQHMRDGMKTVVVPTKLSQNGVISGKYVIQAGTFKTIQQAQLQCIKIKKNINFHNKQCRYVLKNEQYRVIIFPFEQVSVANDFAKMLSKKKFPVLVKKNI